MVRNSESKLFVQSAAAMAGMLLVLTAIGTVFQSKAVSVHAPITAEIHK